eukprot:jgi/Bigna1/84962/estExt_fgenesh1_pg.C_10477
MAALAETPKFWAKISAVVLWDHLNVHRQISAVFYVLQDHGPRMMGAEFEIVPGIFEHRTAGTERESFFAAAPDDPKFGLILPSFKDLHERITAMKKKGDKVKVLYLLRHAEGHHNSAEKEINDHDRWFKDEGVKEKYTDADLNDAGIEQSKELSKRLGKAAKLGLRVERLVTSPLRRAVRTAGIGFNLTEDRRPDALEHYRDLTGRQAVAEELARETIDISEEDKLWTPAARETLDEKKRRVRLFLKQLWRNEKLNDDTYLVVATHSGWINAFLRELHVIDEASRWKPANAQMMGLVVKME